VSAHKSEYLLFHTRHYNFGSVLDMEECSRISIRGQSFCVWFYCCTHFLWSDTMATEKLTREDCLFLLIKKQKELQVQGLTRFPQRSDFTDYEVMSIKAFYGPWPRALEAAGVKEPRGDDRLQKNREKRARAKKRLREAKKAAKAAAEQPESTNNEESQ
ncbi:MAG: hypothetical protein IJC71_07800, partial [Clostridia bacterium]|nr:hypothetical protein [Clostridia bacterium]